MASAEERRTTLEEYVRRCVAEAPPLTASQRAQLARLLANAPRKAE